MTHVAPRPRPKFCGAPARRIVGVGSVPCALTGLSARFGPAFLRIFSPLCAGRSPNPSLRGKVGALRRSLLRQVPDALPGRTARAKAWPARRPPSEHCRRQRLRVLLAVRGFLCTGGRSPVSAGKRLSRRCSGDVMASPFCRGKLPGFSCVSGRMAETHAAGKALTPARSRKRAECGRPGLPHSG